MVYKKSIKFLIVCFFSVYTNVALSNNQIYFVDINFLMNNSLAGKSIIKQLDEKSKLNKKKFQDMENNLREEEKQIISKKNVLDVNEYTKNVEQFTNKVSEYKLLRTNTIEDINQLKNNAQKTLTNSLTPILAEYVEKNNISFIIPKQSIIIGKTELNLTNTILKILDSKIKKINLE